MFTDRLPPSLFTFLSLELRLCSWAREMIRWHLGSAGWWFESSDGSSSPWKIHNKFPLRDKLKSCKLIPGEGVCIINLLSSGTVLPSRGQDLRTPNSTTLSISLYLYKITLHFPNYFSLSNPRVFSAKNRIPHVCSPLYWREIKGTFFENFIIECTDCTWCIVNKNWGLVEKSFRSFLHPPADLLRSHWNGFVWKS